MLVDDDAPLGRPTAGHAEMGRLDGTHPSALTGLGRFQP